MRDTLLLFRATLQLYREALRAGTLALKRNPWIVLLVPVYTIALRVAAGLASGLGIAGGLLLGLALAAIASSFLTVIEQAVRHERLQIGELGATFGRYLSSVVSVLFIFWIIQWLLGAIVAQNPNLGWLPIAVNLGIFIFVNPLPELIYQGQREGLALIDEAIQFIRENAVEWLVPMAVVLSPLLALGPRTGIIAIAALGPMNALALTSAALENLVGSMGGLGPLVALLLAGAAIPWIMLFRGFLFRALHRSSRRQRLFDARMRGL